MSDSDEAMMLFGEEVDTSSQQQQDTALPTAPSPMPNEEIPISINNRFPALDPKSSRIIKLPSSALSVQFDESLSGSTRSANVIQCRTAEDGSVESNARLIEWEDGSWTLVVGNEHFRVFERTEDVHLFDNQDSVYVSVGPIHKQFNVIPGSLDSRTHRHVVEQSAVSRKLNESRKVTLAHGLASASGTMSTIAVNMDAMPQAVVPQRRTRASAQALTADFLEEGFGSVREIKSDFRKTQQPSKRARRDESEDEDEYEQEDVDFLDDDEEEASGSSESSASSGSSDESSSSRSSSDSGSSSDSESSSD